MALDDYRNLSPNDIGSWPMPAKMVVFAVIFILINVGAYFVFWSDQIDEHTALEQKEVELKASYVTEYQKAINLEAYEAQLESIRQSLKELLKQLPKKSEMDALLGDINQAGVGRGLSFELFKPAAAEIKTQEMAELPIELKIKGPGYHDFAKFASDIAQLPRIVILTDINITAEKDRYMMGATVKTFRYLDEDEISAIKAAAAKPAVIK